MVLEETIKFSAREDAVEFQKYLREKGCPSRISLKHDFSGNPCYEASISEFKKFIDMILKEDADADLSNLKSSLDYGEAALNEFMESHEAGDVVTESTPAQLLAQALSISSEGDDVKKEAEEKFSKSILVMGTLENNGLIEQIGDTDGFILKEKRAAGDIKMLQPYTDFDGYNPTEFEGLDITTNILAASKTDFVVTAGAEILLKSDMDEMVDILDDLDTDEDDAARFIDNIFFKKILVSKILEFVDNGAKSEKEISDLLGEPYHNIADSKDTISFDIDSDYLSEVISDLKKEGLLSGKDGKIKSN